MLKRALLLCLGLWLIAAAGLSAHAGPCDMGAADHPVVAQPETHAHCDTMAAPETLQPDDSAPAGTDGNCCCPAVVSPLPATALPELRADIFALDVEPTGNARASSRTLIPEPPPPKA